MFGYGGIAELLTEFPDKRFTFNSIFFPKNTSYASTQCSDGRFGEMTVNEDGHFNLTNPAGSFSIFWFIN